MQPRFSKVGAVVICLLLVAVTLASAATNISSSQGGALDGAGGWQTVIISASAQGSGGTCSTQSSTAFYQWVLTAIADGSNINNVSVSIPVASSSRPVAAEITLYGTTADTWPPTANLLGGALSTVNWAAGSGATTLDFLTTPALVQYVKDALPDNTANFAIRWSTCPGLSINTLTARFGAGSLAQMTVDSTTAVTMSTFRSADPAVNWPLIAGLGALAAVVIGGLAVNRKRAAGR